MSQTAVYILKRKEKLNSCYCLPIGVIKVQHMRMLKVVPYMKDRLKIIKIFQFSAEAFSVHRYINGYFPLKPFSLRSLSGGES